MGSIRMALAFTLLTAVAAGGCAGRVVDPLAAGPLAKRWPPPPDEPRVRYLGQLTGSEDFHEGPRPDRFLKELIHGPQAPTLLVTPMAVAVGADGWRVAVADSNTPRVHLFDLERKRHRLLPTAKQSPDPPFECPVAIAWVGENLWVADSQRGAVGVLAPNGALRWVGDGALKRPAGMAWDAQKGRCYVADAAAHRVVVFDAGGRVVDGWGTRGAGPGALNFPSHIASAGPEGLVVADSLNFRVQRLAADGAFLSAIGRKGDAAGDLALPKGVAVDASGNIWIADAQFENIQAFTPDGKLLMGLGREGNGVGEFWLPSGLCIDATNRLWVADSYNRRVQVFQLL
jgi:hypothetical protein